MVMERVVKLGMVVVVEMEMVVEVWRWRWVVKLGMVVVVEMEMVVEVEVEMEMVVGSEMEMGMGKIEFVGFVDARMEWNRNEWRGNDAATGSCRVAELP